MIPNCGNEDSEAILVVNCFQNCIFTYDSQHKALNPTDYNGCELLSELYFYLWFPTSVLIFLILALLWIAFRIVFLLMIPNWINISQPTKMLWIAFRIVFLLMIPNSLSLLCTMISVVNCFQNCIFTYDSQRPNALTIKSCGCELLSELYFYLWFPTTMIIPTPYQLLWIAFRIVFLLMIPNKINAKQREDIVVNCFQNCIFTYDSQLTGVIAFNGIRCELLSELYFYLWFPTYAKCKWFYK